MTLWTASELLTYSRKPSLAPRPADCCHITFQPSFSPMKHSHGFAPIVLLRSVVTAVLAAVLAVATGCSDSAVEQTDASPVAEPPVESSVASDVPADRALPAPPDSDSNSADRVPAATSTDTTGDQANAGEGGTDPAVAESTSAEGMKTEDQPKEKYVPAWEREGPSAEEIASKAFQPPPDAKSLTEKGRLWIDVNRNRVYLDGYVALKSGPLEMFACPVGTKEHESIVAALARSRELHAALLAIQATPGSPVQFRPEFRPPSGQVIRVWVCWYDEQDQFQVADAREWIGDLKTKKSMTAEWVFAGSGFWEDPEDKREYYLADSGDMICVSNFSSALLDVAIESSADAGSLRFVPHEMKIPEPDTPVRLVLTPVPDKSKEANADDESNDLLVPTAADVPRAKSSE